MKALKALREQRATKVTAMNAVKDEQGENLDKVGLASIKTFGDEIQQLDMQIEAILETQKYALNNAKPLSEKKDDFVAKQTDSFAMFIRGKISANEHKSNVAQYKNAGGAGTAGKGLELVPDEFMRVLRERVLEYGMVVPELEQIRTSNHGVLSYPTMDDTANSAVWLDEHATITLADFATGKIDLNAFKLATGVVLSNELIEDSFFNIVTYSANLLGIRIGRTLEASVINGDGVKKPMGILNTVAIAGTVKATVAVTTATTAVVVQEDFSNLIDAVQPSQRAGAKFYVGEDILRAMTRWVDTTGRKLLQPLSSSTDAMDVIYEYEGYPVVANYELGGLTAGDESAIFGNVKNYTLRVVRDIRVKASDEVNMMTDETVVVATMRVDGRVTSVNQCFSKLVIA